MIKSVRFAYPIEVVKNPKGARTTWEPGQDGIVSIERDGAWLVFKLGDGNQVEVTASVGCVLTCTGSAPILLSAQHGPSATAQQEVKSGPASSAPSADPPPARPIRKGR